MSTDDAPFPTRRDFLKSTTVAAAAAAAGRVPGAWAAGSDAIRVGLIGCGGRGTGAAEDVLAASPGREARRDGRRLRGPPRRRARRSSARSRYGDARRRARRALLRRVRRLQEGARRPTSTSSSWPRRPASGPMHLAGRRRGGQARVHGEAGRRRRPRHPRRARRREEAKAKKPRRRRRHAAPPPDRLPRDDEAHPRRRDRRHRRRALLLEPGRPVDEAAQARVDRHGVADPQLALLHLALRRPHRRAARPQPRRGQLGDSARTPSRALGMGGRQVRTEPGYGHIFDHFAIEYEYPDGVHVHEHVPADRRAATSGVAEGLVGTKGTRRARTRRQALRASTARTPGGSSGERNDPYVQEHIDLIASIRAGKPLNELKTRRREHADRDHGPHVGLHRQGRDVGAGAQFPGGAGAAVGQARLGPDAGPAGGPARKDRARLIAATPPATTPPRHREHRGTQR